MQLPAVEHFPADSFAGLQPDGLGQSVRQIDVEAGALGLGADGLNAESIVLLHIL
jgi:hypothetical protein